MRHTEEPMEEEPRRLRADAERNRRRLVEAAAEMFAERGLEVGVGEIAERAGVGRGTLFRNFASKDALVSAVVAQRIRETAQRGRERSRAPDAGTALFALIDDSLEFQQSDRTLFEALNDEYMVHPEIRAAHREVHDVIHQILVRAQADGSVRSDISAIDLVLMVKGVCESARAFQHLDAEVGMRQLGLVKAAIAAVGTDSGPLRGVPPTIEDLERTAETATPETPIAETGSPAATLAR